MKKIRIAGGEFLELRKCEKPEFVYKKPHTIEGIGECLLNNYGKSFICIDEVWYMVWHYAFHCTFLREGAKSYAWGWAPKYN